MKDTQRLVDKRDAGGTDVVQDIVERLLAEMGNLNCFHQATQDIKACEYLELRYFIEELSQLLFRMRPKPVYTFRWAKR